MKKLITTEFILLLVGVLFAWTNFIIELINWLNARPCTTGCSAGVVYPLNDAGIANPFLTPCFYGALMFTATFIISALILKKSKQ